MIELELPLFRAEPEKDYSWLMEILRSSGGSGWLTAKQILDVTGQKDTDQNRRSIRAIAEISNGQIGAGQKGYKLVELMTIEEYNGYRNWMLSQTEKMQKRILASDKIFYARKPVPA